MQLLFEYVRYIFTKHLGKYMYQVGQQVSEPPLCWHGELLSWKDFVKMEPPPSSSLTAGRQLAGGHVDCLNCTYIISVVILRNVVPLLNTKPSFQSSQWPHWLDCSSHNYIWFYNNSKHEKCFTGLLMHEHQHESLAWSYYTLCVIWITDRGQNPRNWTGICFCRHLALLASWLDLPVSKLACSLILGSINNTETKFLFVLLT